MVLTASGKKKRYPIHHLVLLVFCGERLPGQITRHLNSDPGDNRLTNLQWATQTENMADRKERGLYLKHEHHVMAKLSPEQVQDIKTSSLTGKAMADKHGIGTTQVWRIRNGKSWA